MISKILACLAVILVSQASEAKCLNVSKEQIYERIPYFVKGIVRDLKSTASRANPGSEEIIFKIEIISVLKGDLKTESLTSKYDWSDSKEPIRKYRDGQTYIFPIESIKSGNAQISASTCTPQFSEDELSRFKSAQLIPNKDLAIKIAEAYLSSIYGESILTQRPFQASIKNDDWIVRGTFHCPTAQKCSGGVAEIKLSSTNGAVLNYIHGK